MRLLLKGVIDLKTKLEQIKEKLIEIEQAEERDDVNKKYNELENLFDDGSIWWLVERAQELEGKLIEAKDDYDYLSYHYGNETEQNKRHREAIDYVTSAEPTHYASLENALEDIKFVINEILEESE